MSFIKIVRFDIIHGFAATWKVFLWEILLADFVTFDFWRQSKHLQEAAGTPRTLGDFALYAFGGMKEYIPSPYEPFRFPTLWMLIFFLICFSTLWYPFRDLHGFGRNVLAACRSRRMWYLSKCLWCTFTVSLNFVLFWGVFMVGCGLTGSSFRLDVSPYMGELFEMTNQFTVPRDWEAAPPLLFGPWFTALSLSLLQLAVSICLHPVLGFCFSGILLIASAYYFSPFLPGNYGMVIRDNCFLPGGMSFEVGACYLFLTSLCFLLLGLYLFRRYDILEKGGLRQE